MYLPPNAPPAGPWKPSPGLVGELRLSGGVAVLRRRASLLGRCPWLQPVGVPAQGQRGAGQAGGAWGERGAESGGPERSVHARDRRVTVL